MPILFSCAATSAAEYAVQVADSDVDALLAFLNLPSDRTGQINPAEL